MSKNKNKNEILVFKKNFEKESNSKKILRFFLKTALGQNVTQAQDCHFYAGWICHEICIYLLYYYI